MKRNEIVNQLMAEGFSEKTLVQLSDKQLVVFAERILGEAIKTTAAALSKSADLQNLAKKQDVVLVGETETNEELKGNQKKLDKNHNGKIDGQDFKILQGQKKKKEDVNEVDMGLTIKGSKSTTPKKKSTPKKKEETTEETEVDESLHGLMIGVTKEKLKKDLGREPEHHEVEKELTKFVDDWKKDNESKEKAHHSKEKDVDEEKPSSGLSKEKKSEVVKKAKKGGDIGKKGKGFEKLSDKATKEYGSKEKGEKVAAASMWKNIKREQSEVKNWVKGLVENEKFHNFTSKNEIMELIQVKLNENEKHEYGPNVKTGHNGLPEFMTYDAIKSSAPTTKPAPTKPKVDPGTKPKTPYEPGPGKNPKPKAGLRNLPENEVMELDHQELVTSDRFEKLRTALSKNSNVSVAYVKKDGTVRHMLVKRYLSTYVPSDREKSEKQMNINQNHDVKRVIDVNAYIKSLRETGGDKEVSAKKAWRTINLKDVLGFMVKGEFIDLRDENEIQQRFGDDVNNSLTKSMINAMQAEENNAEVEMA